MNTPLHHQRAAVALFVTATLCAEPASAATLQPRTVQAWETYIQSTERRIDDEIGGETAFLILDFKPQEDRAKIRKTLDDGRVYVEKLKTRADRGKQIKVEDGMIHHWYGAILVPDVTLETLTKWVQDYDRHSEYFAEVEKSKLLARDGDNFQISLRLVRKKIVTVRYNTEHAVMYRTHAANRVSSRSVAGRIAEVSGGEGAAETEKTSADDSGFLWRLNSYWRFVETDRGVIVECESISLSRSIPFGLGWLIGPFVESVPRESLNDMLVAIRDGMKRKEDGTPGP